MPKILCSVSTKGRYHTTLPLTIQAIINQTKPVDKLIVFDDNDTPEDMRNVLQYQHFFKMLDIHNIPWEWVFAEKKGQHYNHQKANLMGYDWVWRVDDDAIPKPTVLENLSKHIADDVGAIGGGILTPPLTFNSSEITGLIENIDKEPNIQWNYINEVKYVEHLHCSFLYRAGVADYNLKLSKVAHREETLFTYQLHKKGYRVMVVPNADIWHLKNPNGGIRSEPNQELYEQDERLFKNMLEYRHKNIVVLNCGMGDHVVFSEILPLIKDPEVFTCYPEIVPGKSIAEAQHLFGDIDQYNIYRKMDIWKWKESIGEAFRKLYL
jgi:GT2 family glycosyltransferase